MIVRNDWVLIVDCDERITPELWAEIAVAIAHPEFNGYYLNRKVFFLGKWIRYEDQIGIKLYELRNFSGKLNVTPTSSKLQHDSAREQLAINN